MIQIFCKFSQPSASNFKGFSSVQLFWEGYKNLRNLPQGFEIYLVNVKTMRTIAQIFVAFLEKPNLREDR